MTEQGEWGIVIGIIVFSVYALGLGRGLEYKVGRVSVLEEPFSPGPVNRNVHPKTISTDTKET